MKTSIRFSTFPRTEPPPAFAENLIAVFRKHELRIATTKLEKGLSSDEILGVLRDDLIDIGFAMETGKRRGQKIERPVFYGENGAPTLKYEVDGYHSEWRCGLELEAGRAWMGNAVYRDLVQALVMVQVEHLAIAVPNSYRYRTGGRLVTSADYDNARGVAETLYGHDRIRMPYGLILIGY